MKFQVLDLFAGIGGFTLGLERTKQFETVAFCENDKDCQKVLQKNWSTIPIFNNIEDLTNEKLQEKNINPNVITGGFPCQDISNANINKEKTGGITGKRSGLWSEYGRLIKEIKPSWAIIENVAGMDDGVSRRAYRVRQLGNSVVPQIPEMLGKCILDQYN